MIETNKVPHLLTEYVLDLLPPAEKQRLAQQIGADPALQAQVQQERQVGQLVKQTVQQAGQADNAQLARLMPAVPRQKRPFWHNPAAQQAMRQVAMAAMMFWWSSSSSSGRMATGRSSPAACSAARALSCWRHRVPA